MLSSNRVINVRVTNISKIKPCSPPSSNTTKPTSLKLSFFDTLWIFVSPIRRLLLFKTDNDQNNTTTPFEYSHHLHSLKHSLSLALNHFFPLTKKLIYSSQSNELTIGTNTDDDQDDDGVVFIEAESDGDFQTSVLNQHGFHDVEAFQALVPKLDVSELPASLLCVQVTRFAGGGLAVGVSAHHVAVDGMAFWYFMRSWAEICRSGGEELVGRLNPTMDRSVIKDPYCDDHEGGLSKIYLKKLSPSLPKLVSTPRVANQASRELKRRTFFLNSKDIRLLKQQSICDHHNSNDTTLLSSTFVVVAAHVWLCVTRARNVLANVNNNAIAYIYFAADCRSRIDPPLGEGYFGNCIRPCKVEAKVLGLLGEDGFKFATTAIKRAVDEVSAEPLKDCMDWADWYVGLNPSLEKQYLHIGGSPRLKVYDTNFGWGRPCQVESVSINGDGVVILSDLPDDEGGVQVSLALCSSHMDKFGCFFVDRFYGQSSV